MNQVFSTPILQEIYPKVKTFIETEIYPNENRWLAMPFAQAAKEIRAKREAVKVLGAWNLYHIKGLTLVDIAQLCELLGTTPFGHFMFNAQAPDAGNMELLALYGSDEINEKYTKPLMNGEIRSCFSMTEPHFAGSNPVRMGTTAVREGDEYVINGHKWFTSSADGAAFAIVMAVTNPDAAPHKRASMIIVPLDSEGFEFVRNIPIFGHEGDDWNSHAEVKYHNVRVPIGNILGEEGDGFKLAQQRLGPGRIHHCMRWIGQCERAFDLMCKRAVKREIGQEVLLGEKQMIQDMIATSRAEIDAARLMVLHTAHAIQTLGTKAAGHQISTIKFYAANVLQNVVDRAIQVHGALGVTDDILLGHFFREGRTARIYDGPDEAHKASLARQILKGYGLEVKNN